MVVPFLDVNRGEIIRDDFIYIIYRTLKTLEANNNRAMISHKFE